MGALYGSMRQQRLSFEGLRCAPAQVCGQIRLVPLIRDEAWEGLRLGLDKRAQGYHAVGVRGGEYFSYVPQGLVMSWAKDGAATAAWETGLAQRNDAWGRVKRCPLHVRHKQVKRVQGARELSFLPLHLAIEGFLSQLVQGPQIAWREYSREALRFGAGAVCMESIVGAQIAELEQGLLRYEIHEGQCGVVIFVGERLATVLLVAHPQDYRAMHSSLIHDFYAPLLASQWAIEQVAPRFDASELDGAWEDVDGLLQAYERAYARWSGESVGVEALKDEIFGQTVPSQRVYKAGPYELTRFVTAPTAYSHEAHIGESIVDAQGRLGYLRTYRLSSQQVLRLALLQLLAECDWSLSRASELAAGRYPMPLHQMLIKNGLGYLLKESLRR